MIRDDRQLTDRLRSAFEIEMTDDTRDRHLSAISAALMEAPVAAAPVVPVTGRWRHRLAGLVLAATVVTPAAVAVAAESSLPGDLLYPVKQVTEEVRLLVDPAIVARHRLEEAESMLARGFPIDQVDSTLSDADRAITDAGNRPDLRSRWAEMRDHADSEFTDDIGSGMPHDGTVSSRSDDGPMHEGTGDPMTDEVSPSGGTDHDRPGGTYEDAGPEMGATTDEISEIGAGPGLGTKGSDPGTVEDHADVVSDGIPGDSYTEEMPADSGSGGSYTEEMPADSGSGDSYSEEMPADSGSGTQAENPDDTWSGAGSDQGSGMEEDSRTSTDSGHDRNG